MTTQESSRWRDKGIERLYTNLYGKGPDADTEIQDILATRCDVMNNVKQGMDGEWTGMEVIEGQMLPVEDVFKGTGGKDRRAMGWYIFAFLFFLSSLVLACLMGGVWKLLGGGWISLSTRL